ncbi:MAG: glycosyltransferase family 9 protein [Lentisphaerae bacterium]|nr:glycosyltransferase family 9 protein [Lentisphaerota bacterium]
MDKQLENRILIIKLSSLGDLFHALPAVHELKTQLNASVDWVVQDEYKTVVSCFTDVDRVISFYRRGFLRNLFEFRRELRARRYDYVIDMQGLFKSALVVGMAVGDLRIGPSFHREGARFFYDAIAGSRNKNRHAVEENMDVLSYFGLSAAKPVFPVKFPSMEIDRPRPRIAILPVSRWHTKNWPSDYYVNLVKRIRQAINPTIFILGGPDDADVCAKIAACAPNVVNLAGRLTLPETGGLLSQVDLLIGNDSGPVHMAVAVGTPTLTIYGPTDPTRTGPYGHENRVVTADLDCRPCFCRTCRRKDLACLTSVTPERIANEAFEMLEQTLR